MSVTAQNLKYSARLTGNQFLYNEFKTACRLLSQGFNKKDGSEKIINENLFEYRSLKSIGKHISAVWERAEYLDSTLINDVFTQPNEIGRIINFYAILKYDLLFLEFMEEVITDKFYTHQLELSKADISNFFATKAEQSDIVSGFKDTTLKRLRLAYFEILQGAGYIIKNGSKTELNKPIAIYKIGEYLKNMGEKRYAKAILGE